jgi:phosphoglycerate dehydrogenase-like enzyme
MNFFSMETCFSKMKPSAVFINVGRGDTVVETDLIKALQDKLIAGAVLDVYRQEPLPAESPLWKLSNVLMYPHCADDDPEHIDKRIVVLNKNIAAIMNGQPLSNLVDKNIGY